MAEQVAARCLCGHVEETVQVAAPLPHRRHLCHCNPCRYSTGVLFYTGLSLVRKPSFVDRLARYDSSHKLSRYFCPTCGSHMLIHVHKHDLWELCSGVVERVVDDGGGEGGGGGGGGGEGTTTTMSLEIYTGHEFVEDTVDGGLAVCFTTDAEGKQLDFYVQGDVGAVPVSPSMYLSRGKGLSQGSGGGGGAVEQTTTATSHTAAAAAADSDDKLHASCHCGGVQFYVTRPMPASQDFSSPWPDLIVASQESHSANPDDVKWWLRANNTKYLAGTCVCRSCSRASGVPVQTWAFVPRVNLQLTDGKPWQPTFGTLAQYRSSEGVMRHFCQTCGATAFWRSEVRPQLVDVSVGLLRAPEGARAENWLEWWTGRVSFAEHAVDVNVAKALGAGLRALK